jgi:hypothetical protein
MNKLNINLAARPLRNRRFFIAAAAGLGLLAVLALWLGLGSFVAYKSRQSGALKEYDRLDGIILTSERERNTRDIEIKESSRKNKEKVDLVNSIIMRKAFSWVEFFTLLEGALPPSSYISSMAPVTVIEGRFEVKLKVVSRSMSDLIRLTQNLMSVTGNPPFVLNETKTGGQLVSEITLAYEKSR